MRFRSRQFASLAALGLAACATASAPISPLPSLGASDVSVEDTLKALNQMCRAEALGETGVSGMTARSPGMGTGGFRADTTSLEAQAWFDYGLQLSHAFYHEDAKVAMDKAVSIDPECSICTSGRAWVLGPTLNYPIDDTQRRVALAAAERARSLAKPTDLLAKQLADALVARYAPGAPGVSEPAFGREMLSLAERNPDIADLAVLASHSLLIPVRANDKSGLKPALKLLEGALSKRPDDTGAIHFFIHATEFDGRAEDAIGFAERLGILAPAASHLVHMPAHTFFHAGRYQDAALVNAEAIGVDRLWMSKGGDRGKDGTPMYYSHNLAFGVAGAMMSGDAALALKFASHAKTIWPESAPTGDRSYPISRTYVVLARYAPEEALKLQPAAEFNPRLDTYLHYARGEAFLGLGDLSSARKEVGELETVISRMGKSVLPEAEVAINVLRGRIAMRAGRHEEAIRRYAVATSAQEKKLSDIWDPPLWWYPVRRSLAAAYLASDDVISAEREARASLSQWKNDPLALFVLGKSLQAQGKTSEGATALDQSRRSWRGDFSSLSAEII